MRTSNPRKVTFDAPIRSSALFLILLFTASIGVGAIKRLPSAAQQEEPKDLKQAEAQQTPRSQEKATQEKTAQVQEGFAAQDDTRPAGEVYKSIQVLKRVPANQIVGIMKNLTSWLGVRCEHCHVTAPGSQIPGFGAFSKDDLEAKQIARKMLQMVGEINEKYFPQPKKGPTCWTCHRGSTKPEIEMPAKPPATN